jgi:putative DNA primase/helicase
MVMADMITTTRPLHRATEIARTLRDRTEDVVGSLLGEPSSKSRREWRWGRRGSLWVSCAGQKRGTWYDHERGEGGDLLDLIARERGVPLRDAIAIAGDMLQGACNSTVPRAHRALAPQRPDTASRTAMALRLWHQSTPIDGTLAEKYFVSERRLAVGGLPLAHAVRWHSRMGAVVALMTDPQTGEAIGIHRTFLDASGKKLDRRMLGRQGVIRISPDEAIANGLGVAEGIEDALAVLLSGWTPVWAATSAGAIARLPVLAGIESITVFADADEAGLQAAETCCDRWRAAGREAHIAVPGRSA